MNIIQAIRNFFIPKLYFQLLSEHAKTPIRGTPRSSGLDVFTPQEVNIPPRGDILIPLDIRFEIPYGWDITTVEKSGVATKKKLDIGGCLIDEDYRGNCHVHLFNNSDKIVHFDKHDKIAQLVMRRVWIGELIQKNDISINTQRGGKGFGSTGTK